MAALVAVAVKTTNGERSAFESHWVPQTRDVFVLIAREGAPAAALRAE